MDVACPKCSTRVVAHCDNTGCKWLVCVKCQVIFGKNNFILYGKAETEAKRSRRRINGG